MTSKEVREIKRWLMTGLVAVAAMAMVMAGCAPAPEGVAPPSAEEAPSSEKAPPPKEETQLPAEVSPPEEEVPSPEEAPVPEEEGPPAPTLGTIVVNATLDGSPWSGGLDYTMSGPATMSAITVPDSFANKPIGTYTVTYNSGGPSGAVLASITPSESQTLPVGGAITFSLNFTKSVILSPTGIGTLNVNATLDGYSWTGNVNYTFTGQTGQGQISGTSVPGSFTVATGSWAFTSASGGPSGAVLFSVTPDTIQTLTPGGTITFTLNFASSLGTINVNATLDGHSWSGALSYHLKLVGTNVEISATSVPQSFTVCPGTWGLIVYSTPPLAFYVSTTPSVVITLTPGGTNTFTIHFHSYSTISINATLDGSQWAGTVSFTVVGPETFSGIDVYVPYSTQVRDGTYTITYSGGGPAEAILSSITPSAAQTVAPGGTITFTLNFISVEIYPPPPEPRAQ